MNLKNHQPRQPDYWKTAYELRRSKHNKVGFTAACNIGEHSYAVLGADTMRVRASRSSAGNNLKSIVPIAAKSVAATKASCKACVKSSVRLDHCRTR